MTDQRSFTDQVRDQLDKFSEDLKELEAKSHEFEASLKAEFEKGAAEMREMAAQGHQRFQKVADATEEEWERFREETEFAARAMRNSFNYFLSHYRRRAKERADTEQ